MKTLEERFAVLQDALSEFGSLQRQPTVPTLCAPYEDDLSGYGFEQVPWAPYIWQGSSEPLPKDHELFQRKRVFAIGLSSVYACLQLELTEGASVLDMCAAPGIKSLYLQVLYKRTLTLHVNDVDKQRLQRLRSLFEDFNVPLPTFNNTNGRELPKRYGNQFDAVLLDAPCSGEGEIYAGSDTALAEWSLKKVNGLMNRQRGLLLAARQLVKSDGTILYATCTLNRKENEQALKKARFSIDNISTLKMPTNKTVLQPGEAARILPSKQAIGFFVAKLR